MYICALFGPFLLQRQHQKPHEPNTEEESEEHIMKKLNFYFFEMLIQKQTHFNIKAYIAQTIEVFV